MFERSCPREPDVRLMARDGGDRAALREHVAECAVCQETLAVSAYMVEVSALPLSKPSTLEPRDLWWKAQLLSRWDAQRQAAAPIEVGEQVQIGIGVVGIVALLVYLWRGLATWTTASPGAAPWVLTQLPQTLTAVVIVSILLLVVTAAVAIRGFVAEE